MCMCLLVTTLTVLNVFVSTLVMMSNVVSICDADISWVYVRCLIMFLSLSVILNVSESVHNTCNVPVSMSLSLCAIPVMFLCLYL